MESSNSTTTPQPPPQPTATIVALPPPSPAPPLGTRASTRSNNNNNDFTTIPLVANDDNKNNIPDTSNDAALAAALAAQEEEQEALLLQQQQHHQSNNNNNNNNNTTNSNYRHATASFPWQYDDAHTQCHGCGDTFNLLNRRHHCRLCGHVFCHHCTDQKALLPPSQIVLTPQRRPTTTTNNNNDPEEETRISFTPNEDPDRMLTYYAPTAAAPEQSQQSQQQQPMQLLYGQGLEERFHLARAPQRVCRACYSAVQPLQLELRHTNSHCRRYNSLDPSDPLRRHFNSPLAFTLGHEIRKAAYTLHNLLPQPRRRLGALVDHYDNSNHYHNNNNTNTMWQSEVQECQQNCRQISFNGSDWDGVRIPARLLEQAKGLAVVTTLKGGFGVAGIEFGTGLVVARRNNGSWSAPSAIQMVSVAWGLLLGAQMTDHVFVLLTDDAVASLLPHQAAASVQLGVDVAVAVGPLGRSLEGDWHVTGSGSTNTTNNNNNPNHATAAPSIYTYSLSKGLYAGVSLDGKIVTTRHDLNETFYGRAVTPAELWHHEPQPPAAQPLYEALQRCHVYATTANTTNNNNTSNRHRVVPESSTVRNEYGEVDSRQWRGGVDAPSVANMSDITDF